MHALAGSLQGRLFSAPHSSSRMKRFAIERILMGLIALLTASAVTSQVNQWSASLPFNDPLVQQSIAVAPEDINICGTAPGQTPFTIDAQLISNYNGFGVSCKDTCDATVQVTVTGGSGTFTFQWVGGPNTAIWNAGCGGTEIVIVTDVVQGIQCAAMVPVTEPSALSVIFVGAGIQAPSCSNACDGMATYFAVGGAGVYTYEWNNGPPAGNTVNDLCPGLNVLHIEDQNGCFVDTSFFLTADPILPNETVGDISCYGVCDGWVNLTVSGGQPGYVYDWVPAPPFGQFTDSIWGLCAGDYTVTITDANFCDTSITVTIIEPLPIVPNDTAINATCWDVCDGEASVNPMNAMGPFTYDWIPDPPNGDFTPTATALCPGIWEVLITDLASGCDTLVSLNVGSPPELEPMLNTQDAQCADACDGEAEIIVTGGTPGYQYFWDPEPGTGQGTNMVTGLCAGPYTLTITDNANCDSIISFIINEPSEIESNLSTTDVTCFGECDGTAAVSPIGGTPGYIYDWFPPPPIGFGTDSVSGLCPGPWSVTITDVNGCDTTITFMIDEPTELTATVDVIDVTCLGDCNGSAMAIALGGTLPYDYFWDPAPAIGQGTDQASGFCSGNYTLTVTDGNNCELLIPFVVSNPDTFQLSLLIADPTCGSICDGTADLTVTGGNGGYSYFWDPTPLTGQGTSSVTGLCLDNYTVTVTDSLNCDTTLAFELVNPPLLLPGDSMSPISCANSCDGEINFNPIGGLGSITYFWDPEPPNGQGVSSGTGLCPGSYEITLTDSTGCDTTVTFSLSAPASMSITTSQTDLECAGVCIGTAVLDVVGSDPFTYFWSPPPPVGQGTDSVAGLCAGPWQVLITDSNGCDSLIEFTILEPDSILIDPMILNTSCAGECNGAIDLAVTGGTGNLSYSWSPPAPVGDGTPNISGLCPGTWSVTITDSLNCSITELFVVDDPALLDAVFTINDPSCGTNCDGTASVVVTGGYAPYDYFWDPEPAAGQGTANVTGICLGNYTLLITDSLGCDSLFDFSITTPPIILANETIQDASCNNVCDGEIALSPSGGVGTLTITSTPLPPNGQGVLTATGLCAGTYLANIADTTGCDTTFTIEILAPPDIVVAPIVTEPDCAGECTGSIGTPVISGVAPFNFFWSPPPAVGQGTDAISGICAGEWTVLIADGNGCDTTLVFDLGQPDSIDVTLLTTPSSCGGSCTGTATVTASGGTGTLSYFWSPPGAVTGQGTPMVTDLCPGAYTLTITDSLNCDTSIAFTISTPSGIVATPAIQDATCANVCNGAISLSTTGGVPPYSYNWYPTPIVGQGTPDVTDLCPGTYTVIVSDAAMCDTVLVINVGSATLIDPQLSSQDATCFGLCNGVISFSPIGGMGPFDYFWVPEPPSGQNVPVDSNLCAGSYDITISDQNGCDTTVTVVIGQPDPFTISLQTTQSHCSTCDGTASVSVIGGSQPYSVTWFDGTGTQISTLDSIGGQCAGVFQVVISDANNCDSIINFLIDDVLSEVLTTSKVSASCADTCDGEATVSFTCSDPPCQIEWLDAATLPIGQIGNTATGLCAGRYFVLVTNNSGCISVDTVDITAPSEITVTEVIQAVDCPGQCNGFINVSASGGVGTLQYVWDPPPPVGQNTPIAQGLCAGSWNVTIIDANLCDTTITYTIVEPDPIVPGEIVTAQTCSGICDGSVYFSPTGGTAPYTYIWSPIPPGGQGQDSVAVLCPGTYVITVFDANNCFETVSLTVMEIDPFTVSALTTNSSCGACTGTATITISGGGGSFDFLWLDSTGTQVANSAFADSLCSGIYTVAINDQNGCDTLLLVNISDQDGEVLTTGSNSPSCAATCDGEAFVSFMCTSPPCLVNWYDAVGNSLGISTDTLSPVCAGTYLVSVINADSCLSLETIVVLPLVGTEATITSTPISCTSACDGTANVSVNSGIGPFTYFWSPAPGGGQFTPNATGLCAGSYSVTISDSLMCDTTIVVEILNLQLLSVGVLVTNNDCAGECNAIIDLTPMGGTPPYFYVWNQIPPNGQGNSQAIGLCSGTYVVNVFDSNNCDTTLSISITDPSPIIGAIASSPSSCGNCDGSVSVSATGGSGMLSYSWVDQSNMMIGTGANVGSLCAGLYSVLISDSLGCDTSLTVAVSDIDGEFLTTSAIPATCANTCDGQAVANYFCNNGSCIIAWFDALGTSIGQTSDTAVGLCAGLYFVSVTNAIGCVTIDTVEVTAPEIGTFQFTTTPISCYGTCDGTATITVNGGIGPFQYDWDPAPPIGQGTDTAEGLCVGSYSVTVTDANLCDTVISVLLIGPDELTATTVIGEPSCNGVCDGSVFVVPNGGVAPFTYTWNPIPSNGQGNNEALGLCSGPVSVEVEDANGCMTILTITVDEPASIDLDLTATAFIDCFGDCVGTANVLITGGVLPYQIDWLTITGLSFAADTSAVGGLCAGTYTIVVTDSAGCSSDTTFTITQGAPLNASVDFTNEGCTAPCDAYAIVQVAGGTGTSYLYDWQPLPPFGAGTDSIAGLCPGPWQVTVTDSLGCDTTIFFTVTTAIPIQVTVDQTDVSCNGSCDGIIVLSATGGTGVFDYTWTPPPPFGAGTDSISGLCPGTWEVLVSDSLGCDTTISIVITQPDSISVQLDQVISPTCASVNDGAISITVLGGSSPFVYQWTGPGFTSFQEDISNLYPGTYNLMILDDANCQFSYSITIDPVIEVTANAGGDTILCANSDLLYLDGSGSIGAVDYSWADLPGNQLGMNDSLAIAISTPGTYTYVLTVSDGGQCFDSDSVVVIVLPLPLADAGPDQQFFGTENIATLGGSPTSQFGTTVFWSPDSLLANPSIQNPDYAAVQSAWFVVYVSDSSGCVGTDSVYIEVLPEVTVPSGFSPNGDGLNDVWEIDVDLLFPELEVEIYNRWGELLYRNQGYTVPWDGKYEGEPVPMGTYYYLIELNSPLVPEPLTGPLTILR